MLPLTFDNGGFSQEIVDIVPVPEVIFDHITIPLDEDCPMFVRFNLEDVTDETKLNVFIGDAVPKPIFPPFGWIYTSPPAVLPLSTRLPVVVPPVSVCPPSLPGR